MCTSAAKVPRQNKCRHCKGLGHNIKGCPKLKKTRPNEQKRKRKTPRNSTSSAVPVNNEGSPSDVEYNSGQEDDGKPGRHDNVDENGDANCMRPPPDESDGDSDGCTYQPQVYNPMHIEVLPEPEPELTNLRTTAYTSVPLDCYPEFVVDSDTKPGHRVPDPESKSVFDLFSLFWTAITMLTFVNSTNEYARSSADKEWKRNLTAIELRRFFGLILFFGLWKVRKRRSCWDRNSKFFSPYITNVMSRHRFEAILRNLHWLNTASFTNAEKLAKKKADNFWSVASLLTTLAGLFQRYWMCGQDMDVDEGGIPTKCYHHAVQYNGDKPKKWFFKVYCLNDAANSYLHNFYLFRGADRTRKSHVPASAFPVIELTKDDVYRDRNHIVYVDNYFQGPYLCDAQLTRGLHTCGTFRTNRIKTVSPVFYTKTGDGRGKRGDMKQHKLKDNLFCTSWWDKRGVNMLSTFETFWKTCRRHDRDKKTGVYSHLELPRPTIIAKYNKGMGGTDLFDQHVSYYRTSVKTKRWPHTVIFHFLLVCVVNSWLLYKDIHKPKPHQKYGNLLSYVDHIVDVMCSMTDGTEEDVDVAEVGEDNGFQRAKKAVKQENVSIPLLRQAGNHYSMRLPNLDTDGKTNRRQCRGPNCKKQTPSYCTKCGEALCCDEKLAADGVTKTTCFIEYHEGSP